MKTIINIFLVLFIFLLSCTNDGSVFTSSSSDQLTDTTLTDNNDEDDYSWTINSNEVFDGGPGKDGIPALENPQLIDVIDAIYLQDDDLILGYISENSIVAFPHKILDWHEIINTTVNNEYISVNYCPLTGTGMAWDRNVNSDITTFGVSGLLYNSNLILYDRRTDSYWSQMKLECVYGQLASSTPTFINIIETTWKTWKEAYPSTKVVGLNTGYSRNYGHYPYGGYKNTDFLLFPVNPDDNRLSRKERVHGIIISGEAKAYQFSNFENNAKLISDTLSNQNLLIYGDKSKNIIVSFINNYSDDLIFTAVENELPIILIDNEGNKWNMWGEAVEGPRMGAKLIQSKSFIGYWFAWGAFYPDLEIY